MHQMPGNAGTAWYPLATPGLPPLHAAMPAWRRVVGTQTRRRLHPGVDLGQGTPLGRQRNRALGARSYVHDAAVAAARHTATYQQQQQQRRRTTAQESLGQRVGITCHYMQLHELVNAICIGQGAMLPLVGTLCLGVPALRPGQAAPKTTAEQVHTCTRTRATHEKAVHDKGMAQVCAGAWASTPARARGLALRTLLHVRHQVPLHDHEDRAL